MLNMLRGPFLDKNFIGSTPDFNEAKIVMLGMPFDGTCTNRSGTRFGPQAIRLESVGIEVYSPTFDKTLDEVLFYDAGDLEFPFGNTKRILDMIKENVTDVYQNGKKLLGIGGEHLVTLPSFIAASGYYDNMALLHFDAHTDLREEYLGETLTHSGVVRRISDIIGFENIMQVGIRSGEKEEFDLMKKHDTLIFDPSKLVKFKNKNIFLSIDLDVLDPGFMSGVGTPEAGGMTYCELLKWLLALKDYNIIGADIVELAPDFDTSKVSTATACTLIREVLMLL